jgi:hypothetical protein
MVLGVAVTAACSSVAPPPLEEGRTDSMHQALAGTTGGTSLGTTGGAGTFTVPTVDAPWEEDGCDANFNGCFVSLDEISGVYPKADVGAMNQPVVTVTNMTGSAVQIVVLVNGNTANGPAHQSTNYPIPAFTSSIYVWQVLMAPNTPMVASSGDVQFAAATDVSGQWRPSGQTVTGTVETTTNDAGQIVAIHVTITGVGPMPKGGGT